MGWSAKYLDLLRNFGGQAAVVQSMLRSLLKDIEVLIRQKGSALETSAGKRTGFESTVFVL